MWDDSASSTSFSAVLRTVTRQPRSATCGPTGVGKGGMTWAGSGLIARSRTRRPRAAIPSSGRDVEGGTPVSALQGLVWTTRSLAREANDFLGPVTAHSLARNHRAVVTSANDPTHTQYAGPRLENSGGNLGRSVIIKELVLVTSLGSTRRAAMARRRGFASREDSAPRKPARNSCPPAARGATARTRDSAAFARSLPPQHRLPDIPYSWIRTFLRSIVTTVRRNPPTKVRRNGRMSSLAGVSALSRASEAVRAARRRCAVRAAALRSAGPSRRSASARPA